MSQDTRLFVEAMGFTTASLFLLVPILFGFARLLGLYVIVPEGRCYVFVLFGKVLAVIDEPGLHFLLGRIGPLALIVNWLGKCHEVDMRLDQQYLRSQPVNSEEGAPMGIGVWYEMFISDPVSFLFKNSDPRGSLSANVSNSTVRSLSNMPLAEMMVNRHTMSRTVREEVSARSTEWGYKLGSVYVRKVHFRDGAMIREIEGKVVNRLRQVTSAIKQDGANQVSVITSTAERQAAVAFAKAAAIRPEIVGEALQEISTDPEISSALFEILEAQKLSGGHAQIILLPEGSGGLAQWIAGQPHGGGASRPHASPPMVPPAVSHSLPAPKSAEWAETRCPSCDTALRLPKNVARVACPHCAFQFSPS
jgi:regulator of protease activity HflC (stomatin/prohibitin superfamily)